MDMDQLLVTLLELQVTTTTTKFITVDNNECFTAFPLLPDMEFQSIVGNTSGASLTNSTWCGGAGISASPDLWYYYSIDGIGTTSSLSTWCSPMTNFDTMLVVFTGSCDALECLDGNDDCFIRML
jgi:hypothetical protein